MTGGQFFKFLYKKPKCSTSLSCNIGDMFCPLQLFINCFMPKYLADVSYLFYDFSIHIASRWQLVIGDNLAIGYMKKFTFAEVKNELSFLLQSFLIKMLKNFPLLRSLTLCSILSYTQLIIMLKTMLAGTIVWSLVHGL